MDSLDYDKQGPKSKNFIRGNFLSGELLAGWKLAIIGKFQHNISKLTQARPKKHRDTGVNTTIHVYSSNGI